jgi:hypothetical protein
MTHMNKIPIYRLKVERYNMGFGYRDQKSLDVVMEALVLTW